MAWDSSRLVLHNDSSGVAHLRRNHGGVIVVAVQPSSRVGAFAGLFISGPAYLAVPCLQSLGTAVTGRWRN